MRVKISYGIDLEELPEEVTKLYDSVAQWVSTIEKQSDTNEDLLEEQEFESCLSMMTKMRETMGKIDARLDDICNILEGYVLYNKENGENHEPRERRPDMDPTSSDVISGTEISDGSNDES